MNEKIEAFIQLRINEAMEKQIPTKARLIALIMGEEFENEEVQWSGMESNGFREEDELNSTGFVLDLMYAGNTTTRKSGIYIYDSIENGNIKVRYDKNTEDLTIHKNSAIVFRETEGVIVLYNPSPHWEVIVNNIARIAEVKFSKRKEKDLKTEMKAEKTFLKKTIEYLTQTWGY